MSIPIETVLSQISRQLVPDANALRSLNQRLTEAWPLAGPLALAGLCVKVRHAHLTRVQANHIRLHRHDHLQIEYLLDGQFEFYDVTEAARVRLTPGQGLGILPQDPHGWVCDSHAIVFGMLLDIGGPARTEFCHRLRTLAGTTNLHRFGSSELAARFVDLLGVLVSTRNELWVNERIDFLLGAWLAGVLPAAWPLTVDAATSVPAEHHQAVSRRAYDFLLANHAHAVQVDDVAREVGLSPRQLNRIFHQHRGESVGTALMRIRLEAAKQMLEADAQLPIKAVGYRCGFTRPAYFTACYRRYFGQVPSQARQKRTPNPDRY